MNNYDFILSTLVGKGNTARKLYVSKVIEKTPSGIAILSSEDIDESHCFESMQEAKNAIDNMVTPYNQNSWKIEIYVRKTGKPLTEAQTAKLASELAKQKPAPVVKDRTNTKIITGASPKPKAKAKSSSAAAKPTVVEQPRKSGAVAEIIALAEAGKSKADIIAAGYNKNTVNRQYGEWLKRKK